MADLTEKISTPKEITRRGFVSKIGGGLLVANLAGPLLNDAAAQLMVPDAPRTYASISAIRHPRKFPLFKLCGSSSRAF